MFISFWASTTSLIKSHPELQLRSPIIRGETVSECADTCDLQGFSNSATLSKFFMQFCLKLWKNRREILFVWDKTKVSSSDVFRPGQVYCQYQH